MEYEDIEIILKHFEVPIWPMTISTKTTQGRQVEVKSINEVYVGFEQANFVDCRINACPPYTNYKGINRQAPIFVMCDLDMVKFRTEKLLLNTVLFTGNGYHVYQPINIPILELESQFAEFQNPSTGFIRYAAQRWTGGRMILPILLQLIVVCYVCPDP
jgi:hypothetical protein